MSATQLAVRTDGFELAPPGTASGEAVRFEAVAISPGVYAAQGELEIRVTEEHLPLVAERLVDAQIRDLHEERIQATVGAVTGARVEAAAVVFEGEIALDPHATIVRRFPESIRFSVGFRFSAEDLTPDPDGVAELPADFIIDHIALVGKGQDPDARLTKLLNRAQRGLDDRDGTTVDEQTIAELRRQRDDALEAEKQARADLAKTESRLETTKDKLDQAEQAKHEAETEAEQAQADAEAARLELERAKAGFATSILKLELKAGEDVDLHQRQQELLEMELSELDELRLELAEQAADQREAAEDEGPTSKPTGTPSTGTGSGTRAGAVAERTMDLEELSLEDTIRLGLVKEVL